MNTTQNATNNTSIVYGDDDADDISPALRIIIGSITAVPIFINIFYVVVCFKEFKKNFHYLLVLMLCIGDSILSLSVTFFSLIKLSDWMATNVKMCLFQIFTVCYGLGHTYSIVLLICYERFVVVKNYNFGAQDYFERFKVVYIGGTLAGVFLVTIETVLFVPHEPTITKCTVPELYGEQFQFFLTFIGIGLSLMMFGIISYSLRTSRLIWKYFFQNNKVGVYYEDCKCQRCKPQDIEISESGKDTEYDQANTEQNVGETNLEERQNSMSIKVRDLISKWRADRTTSETCEIQNCKKGKTKQKKKPDAWEKRAFITTLIIVFSTIFLTYPFCVSFWLDYFNGVQSTSRKTRLYLFVPLVLNSVVNPFIYAWRIPEIRSAIKKIFRC